MPKIYAWVTGERYTYESLENGDAEERGWVDVLWSRRQFVDSRNDARPIVDEWLPHADLPDALRRAVDDAEDREEFAEIIRQALRDTLGAWEDNGDGTFYGVDGEDDYETGDHYTYALHFVIKDGAGERGWHPSEFGIDL